MRLNRRTFLFKTPLAIGAAGAVATPAVAMRSQHALSNAYLKDLAVMLRSAVPIENAVVALGRKYSADEGLAALSLDLVRLLRRPDARSSELARVCADHRRCFSEAAARRLQRCIMNGNLDQVA
jgi:hypothetical protein